MLARPCSVTRPTLRVSQGERSRGRGVRVPTRRFEPELLRSPRLRGCCSSAPSRSRQRSIEKGLASPSPIGFCRLNGCESGQDDRVLIRKLCDQRQATAHGFDVASQRRNQKIAPLFESRHAVLADADDFGEGQPALIYARNGAVYVAPSGRAGNGAGAWVATRRVDRSASLLLTSHKTTATLLYTSQR
jgi:hypothetical protein